MQVHVKNVSPYEIFTSFYLIFLKFLKPEHLNQLHWEVQTYKLQILLLSRGQLLVQINLLSTSILPLWITQTLEERPTVKLSHNINDDFIKKWLNFCFDQL